MKKWRGCIISTMLMCSLFGSFAFSQSDILEKNGISIVSAIVCKDSTALDEKKVFIPFLHLFDGDRTPAESVIEEAKKADYRLLGEDGGTYDLQFETNTFLSDRIYGVMWNYDGVQSSNILKPVQGGIPDGKFVVMGDKKKLDAVSIKWCPAKTVTSQKGTDPFKAGYIDLAAAKREFQKRPKKSAPLTALVLQKAGISRGNIRQLTAEQISSAMHELASMPELCSSVDPDIAAAFSHYYINEWNLLWTNTYLLVNSYPCLFAYTQEYVEAKDNLLLQGLKEQKDNRYLLSSRDVYEISDIKDKLVYDIYRNPSEAWYSDKASIGMIGTIDEKGIKKNIAASFYEEMGAVTYRVDKILGAIEITDKADREIWIVCLYHGGDAIVYSAFQYFPCGPISEKRTQLIQIPSEGYYEAEQ